MNQPTVDADAPAPSYPRCEGTHPVDGRRCWLKPGHKRPHLVQATVGDPVRSARGIRRARPDVPAIDIARELLELTK